ncbi:hypothetical protein Asppvi_005837 [Aspergillus pseudoviridinutans]|uniref:Uncharacterized protein n=1 Tax=Aspergillus pseudoviridinutans TaxID=1517512 RepID=A0A9P3BD24_9EURO|nr:uncharacterized protein Asppvi_005837 [Aspergillus pseudoviridinutans]GIJ86938.1 hypothetical protein Asppvi_005837 [Aspergillus pseudoviridinutans]
MAGITECFKKVIPDLPAQVTESLICRMSGESSNPLPAVHKCLKELLASDDPSRFLGGIGLRLCFVRPPTNYAAYLDPYDLVEIIHQAIKGEITDGLSVTTVLCELASYVVEKPGLASRDSVELVKMCLKETDIANADLALRETGAIQIIHTYADRRIVHAAGHEAALIWTVPGQVLVPLFLKDIHVMTERINRVRNRDSVSRMRKLNAVLHLQRVLREIAKEWTNCNSDNDTTIPQHWDLYDLVGMSMMLEDRLQRNRDTSERCLGLLSIGMDKVRRDIKDDVKAAALYGKLSPQALRSPNFGIQLRVLEEYIMYLEQ